MHFTCIISPSTEQTSPTYHSFLKITAIHCPTLQLTSTNTKKVIAIIKKNICNCGRKKLSVMLFVVVSNVWHVFLKNTALQQNGFCHKIRVSKLELLKRKFLKSVKWIQHSCLVNSYCILRENKHCIFFVHLIFEQTMIIAIMQTMNNNCFYQILFGLWIVRFLWSKVLGIGF